MGFTRRPLLHKYSSFYSYFTHSASIQRVDFTRVPFREKSFDKVNDNDRETSISNLQKSEEVVNVADKTRRAREGGKMRGAKALLAYQ